MASLGHSNVHPLGISEKHGLTDVYVHCDLEFSRSRFDSLNANLQKADHPPVRSRRRQLRWSHGLGSDEYWEFQLETRAMGGSQEPARLHLAVSSRKLPSGAPSAHLRSSRTISRADSFVRVLSAEELTGPFDCHLTWHSSGDAALRPDVLPFSPEFPGYSVIQELSGVIGGSADGNVKFVVDRTATEPRMFHIWLGFQWEATFGPELLVKSVVHGTSMLEAINLWEN